jgi:hypothetical protein
LPKLEPWCVSSILRLSVSSTSLWSKARLSSSWNMRQRARHALGIQPAQSCPCPKWFPTSGVWLPPYNMPMSIFHHIVTQRNECRCEKSPFGTVFIQPVTPAHREATLSVRGRYGHLCSTRVGRLVVPARLIRSDSLHPQ